MLVFLDGTVMKDYEKLAELADAVAGVNKNLQEITYSSENMSTETRAYYRASANFSRICGSSVSE